MKVTMRRLYSFVNVCQGCYEKSMETHPGPVESFQVTYFDCEQCKKHICGALDEKGKPTCR